ncbi:hypothetical protein ACFXPS_42645 [Nocardia sp. NPDC059091]
MWNDEVVRPGRIDLMMNNYCLQSMGLQPWPHPERWRRIFLQVGAS